MAFKYDELIDWSQPSLYIAIGSIIFNPVFWNIVARREHKTHFLTKLAGGPYAGCYLLAFSIFSLGILRDHLYHVALNNQPQADWLAYGEVQILAVVAFVTGGVLVLSSMWALGVTGTYLGDYFGILMEERVESFPFNVTNNPMYYGSTLSFLGTALWYRVPAGLALTVLVFVEYKIALLFEEPFTGAIYAKREADRKAAGGASGSSTAVASKTATKRR